MWILPAMKLMSCVKVLELAVLKIAWATVAGLGSHLAKASLPLSTGLIAAAQYQMYQA